jgi:peptide/nickel transport system substrate-binding protein
MDDEFSGLLAQANGTLDVEDRRQLFCQLEQIQMDRGSIGVAFWKNVWLVHRDDVEGITGQADGTMRFDEAWKGVRIHLPMVTSGYPVR